MATTQVPEQFTGYAAFDAENWTDLKLHKFTPKPFDAWDIDIAIDYCGICGSDLHVLRSGWSPTIYPVVPGHEITGRVVRVGPNVTSIAAGDYVGVGAQAWSCGGCDVCAGEDVGDKHGSFGPEGEHGHGGAGGLSGGKENYCKEVVETYNWRYKDGSLAWGGYADYVRVHENFVYPIPAGIKPEVAAPMLCAGVTMFSPLQRSGLPKGAKVGIVGLGGLGHFGVMFASQLFGYEVTVISHSARKREDALKMGAIDFLESGKPGWTHRKTRTLDLIISTNFSTDMPLNEYLSLLKVGGTLVVCGIPEGDLPKIAWGDIATANLAIRGSNVGSKKEVAEMLAMVAEKGVESVVQVLPMSKAKEAVEMMERGEARYRIVLKADFEK
ncbi:NADPH-dependent medium chain alcohol dehydrogenase [Geopyxis carbonaria]|nr:NADPH-dependent medium chain alcohol dehydrogenase [Geopyxis carbonaria]